MMQFAALGSAHVIIVSVPGKSATAKQRHDLPQAIALGLVTYEG
jgi:hypothetical protein